MTALTDTIAVQQERQGYASVDRDDAIKAIRAALKRRSGKAWSVTGGRGTGWGWIEITAPPKRRTGVHVKNPEWQGSVCDPRDPEWILVDSGEPQQFGLMTPADRDELTALLGLDRPVHEQGYSIAASTDYRVEAVARAEGRNPSAYGTPYWD